MSRETTRVVLVLAMSLHGPDEGLGEAGRDSLGEPGGGGEMLFYVRRHSCADGAFYGHTRRRASKQLSDEGGGRSGAGEVAGEVRAGQGASPQANADADRPPKISHQRPPLSQDGASYERGRIAV